MKKNKIQTDKMFKFNILMYDEEKMKYFQGTTTNFELRGLYDSLRTSDGYIETINHGYDMISRLDSLECLDNVVLDDTLMKRIAVYNKQQECKRIDKQIKEKQDKIKELDEKLQDKEKRWKKVKDFISEIYELNLDDDEDYWDEYEDYL